MPSTGRTSFKKTNQSFEFNEAYGIRVSG